MNKHIITIALSFVVSIVSSLSCVAQARIDRIVKDLEKSSDVEVTYTERRDPKSKKLTRQSIVLTGNNKKQYERLWDAFEQERGNSVSVTKTRNRSFIIKFEEKGSTSSYILSISGSQWSLVVTKRGEGEGSADDSGLEFGDFSFNSLDGLDCLGELNSLDGLECLSELNSLKGLQELKNISGLNIDNINGDVTIYDNEGNIIYSKTSKNKAKANAKSKAKSRSKSTSTSISTSTSGSRTTRTVTTTTPDGVTSTATYYL